MALKKAGRKEELKSDIRVERINKFIERENLSQVKLAEAIGTQQQNISRMLKTKKVSEYIIRNIVIAFPDYREAWFLGYDDYPTYSELNEARRHTVAAFTKAQHEGDLLFMGLWSFAELTGYKVIPPNLHGENSVEHVIETIKTGYQIERAGKVINLSLEEMNHFENMLCDMAESAFKYLFKERGVDNG
jgi:hypothetical protein